MRINAIHESIKDNQITLKWISMHDNIADILTKQTAPTPNRLLSQQILQGVGNRVPSSTKPVRTGGVSDVTKLKKIIKFKAKKAPIDSRFAATVSN
jgi:hypothetical protein